MLRDLQVLEAVAAQMEVQKPKCGRGDQNLTSNKRYVQRNKEGPKFENSSLR